MAFLAQLILAILCLLMFVVNRKYKFAILILSTICFSFVVLPLIPFGGGIYVLANCFFVSELPFIIKHIKNIRKTIIGKVLLIFAISMVIQIITSPHYNGSITNIIRAFILDFTGKYLALGYAFVCISTERDLRPTMRISFYGLLVLTFFAVLNYISRHAIFITELGQGRFVVDVFELLGDKYTELERFRVQAMFSNPFDYGYICVVLAILHGWGYLCGMLQKNRFYISIACCIFGIVTCGCRTVIICAMLTLITYILFSTKLKRRTQYILILCIVGTLAYAVIPYVRNTLNTTMTAFDVENDYGGSSIGMRATQYETVFGYVKGHELFGRGKDFFRIDLGWSEGKWGAIDRDLHGLEGVFMKLLLESGFVGAAFYLIIYGLLFYRSYKYRKVDKKLGSLALSILVAYFSFANMTGELLSVYPSLLVLGSFLSILYYKEQHAMAGKYEIKMKPKEFLSRI